MEYYGLLLLDWNMIMISSSARNECYWLQPMLTRAIRDTYISFVQHKYAKLAP